VGIAAQPGAFGLLLRRYRSVAGLTQEELAHRAGLSVRAVSDMERGHTVKPFIRSVRLLADSLELSKPARARLIAAADGGADDDAFAQPEAGRDDRYAKAVVPRQLPAPVQHFAGRSAELKMLNGLLDHSADKDTVVISAIGGTAGVGKTALAVHWAHQVAELFPDGQLYVNLRGFAPSGSPAAPGDAIYEFLDALGVPADLIPADLDARAAMYRSVLAGKRVLVVLDNARDADQARPLLPASAGCLAVVTSRSPLAGLVAIEAARPISLEVLSEAEATELLMSRLGTDRAGVQAQAVAELIELCARLPLALAVAAARAAIRPGIPLTALVSELRNAQGRLDALDGSDPLASVRAVFSWSYQSLQEPAARMFRLLGVHPGPDISVPAAASLAGVTGPEARRLLDELTCCHLLAEPTQGRFAFHDLLRSYAAEQAGAVDGQAGRDAAVGRVLDHYLHTAHAAALLLTSRDPITLCPTAAGTEPEHLDGYGEAMDWFTAEYRVLLATVTQAAGSRSDIHAWQLPWALEPFLDRQGHWHDLDATQRIALAAAERLGDPAAQAHVHRNIGNVRFWLGSVDDARAHLSTALVLYRELGDCDGQARAHIDLARVFDRLGRYHEALGHSRQAFGLSQAAGHRAGQACALNAIGWYHALLGDHRRALAYCQQALEVNRETADRFMEACIWDSLGYVHHHLEQYADAIACYQDALRLCRELGNRHNQAETLTRLGEAWFSSGNSEAAHDAWRQALAILDDLEHPDAAQVKARLACLG
jgi:tetratricopeptide (TPR) repeat protein/transcriptional regulator with XRE-family HTH domain